jgi:UDP-2-acetamido-3-amino-2,3-dideoxy-glucuronate N-acetyltransferase
MVFRQSGLGKSDSNTIGQGRVTLDSSVHATAVLEEGAQIGYGAFVGPHVKIGANCQIGHHVVIHAETIIGSNVRIDDHATIGKLPMKARISATTQDVELASARIGDDCLIGTAAILYRGCIIGHHVLIADQASVREQCNVGDYTIIGRDAAIENCVQVGNRCKIQAGVYLSPFSEVEDGCFIAPEVTITNDNFMGRSKERFKHHKGIVVRKGGRIGANVTILPGVTIEPDGVAAAGAVVTKDIPARQIVAGVPARSLRGVPEDQLLENQ